MTDPLHVEHPIALWNVTRRFGHQLAVDNLTLQIPRGTTFSFIGLNGAGKTTAIRMMVGLLRPHGGTIAINGIAVPQQRDWMKQHVGYVPDRPNVYPWMRARQAIDFARSFYPKWNDSRCAQLMQMFDPKKRAKHLSKGQGAKLSLLLAICHDPAVLILDEPTSGMDPLVREEFLEGVLAVTGEREQTVLFSSHTLADVQRLADSVGLMHEGRLLLQSPVDVLLEKTKRIRAVLEEETSTHEPPPGYVWEQVRGREWVITVNDFNSQQVEFVRSKNRVSHLDVEDMSLDDVFKDVVRGKQNQRTHQKESLQ
jgi:ABC-2 type transport system ATP-binding protein